MGLPILSDKQRLAIALRVSGQSWNKIAKKVGVSERTIYQWRLQREFQREMAEKQECLFAEIALNHKTYLENAFTFLNAVILNKSGEYIASDRIKAAEVIINSTHKNVEYVKLLERNRTALQEIEKMKQTEQLMLNTLDEKFDYEYKQNEERILPENIEDN